VLPPSVINIALKVSIFNTDVILDINNNIEKLPSKLKRLLIINYEKSESVNQIISVYKEELKNKLSNKIFYM
jgi:hypothetical protein